MTRSVRICLLGGLIGGATLPDTAAGCDATPTRCGPAITIRVYDYAALSNSITKRAQAEVDRIFGKAGVKTEWASCPISEETAPGDPRCHVSPSATDIRLNFLTAGMAREITTNQSVFGAAFPLQHGFGSLASVFPGRIREFAASKGAPEGSLLGHFIAHEIGHLLLGLNGHSGAGIMRAPWSHAQVERAGLGTLLFTKQDAERIKRQASARLRERTARPTVELHSIFEAIENAPRERNQGVKRGAISASDSILESETSRCEVAGVPTNPSGSELDAARMALPNR